MPETKPYQKALESLIGEAIGRPDVEKLGLVNQFFNDRIRYDTDLNVWGKSEYWAGPDELMQRGEPELLTRNSNRLARWRELRERMLPTSGR